MNKRLNGYGFFNFRRGSKASLVLDLRSSTELGTSSSAPSILERYGNVVLRRKYPMESIFSREIWVFYSAISQPGLDTNLSTY